MNIRVTGIRGARGGGEEVLCTTAHACISVLSKGHIFHMGVSCTADVVESTEIVRSGSYTSRGADTARAISSSTKYFVPLPLPWSMSRWLDLLLTAPTCKATLAWDGISVPPLIPQLHKNGLRLAVRISTQRPRILLREPPPPPLLCPRDVGIKL